MRGKPSAYPGAGSLVAIAWAIADDVHVLLFHYLVFSPGKKTTNHQGDIETSQGNPKSLLAILLVNISRDVFIGYNRGHAS